MTGAELVEELKERGVPITSWKVFGMFSESEKDFYEGLGLRLTGLGLVFWGGHRKTHQKFIEGELFVRAPETSKVDYLPADLDELAGVLLRSLDG